MTIRNLERLLRPRSVVLVGASSRAGSVGHFVATNLVTGGFKGDITLVNPKRPVIAGHQSIASLDQMTRPADLAIIATPPATVAPTIARLEAQGTRAAVVITAGLDGDQRTAMLNAAKPAILRIQGPNCLGLMLPRLGLNASFSHIAAQAGDLAFLSQSGALITATVDWAASRNIGFSHVVSLGDMADVDFGDLLDYLAGDTQSRAILLYIESVTQAPKFLSAARRAARSKPVIVVKSGRHAAGAQAALSHTGALAGSDSAYDAAFRRAGLLRVSGLHEMFDAVETLAHMPDLHGERLAILTNGGGAGVLAADRLADHDGRLAALAPQTRQILDQILPPTWSHGNPVDIIGDATGERYAAALHALLSDPGTDAVLVVNCPTALASSTVVAEQVIATVADHKSRGLRNPAVITNWLGGNVAAPGRKLFAEAGIASFETPAGAIDGFMHMATYAKCQLTLSRTPPSQAVDLSFEPETVQATISAALAEGRQVLTEIEAKHVLAAYGIPVVTSHIAATTQDVRALAERLLDKNAAVVIKILSRDITHKSDVGGVRLNLATGDEAEHAAIEMTAHISATVPDARIDGFSVQPMIKRPRAHELIAGVSVDRTFGPLILFGAGGTAVEVMRDTAQALPPLDRMLALDLMQRTRIWRLLEGYRDRPPADRDAIADVLVRLSYLAAQHDAIREIDINPLLGDANGAIALDARITIADPALKPRVAMAIRPYPSGWSRSETIGDLGDILLRPIKPVDEALYAAFFARVLPEDLRLRFFSASPDLGHAFLARMTQIDYAREMAFVAIEPAQGELLGVARFIADPDYRRGEYAVLVRSDLKGRGLGWSLMRRLIDYARSEGLQELYGNVLADNTTMITMNRHLGFTIEVDQDDPMVRRVELTLSKP